MTINVFGGGDSSGPAFPVQRSVRLRSSASAYFSRSAYPVSGAGTKWTMSMWLKRGALSSQSDFFTFVSTTGSAQQAGIQFDSNGAIRWWQYVNPSYAFQKITTAVFRDPSAWYHFVFIYDTTLATAEDRLQIWVNGVRQTSFSTNTNPSQNLVTYYNTGVLYPYLGAENRNASSALNPFDGYLTEVNFIDGQALTANSFGSYNSNGVWQPIKYSGTYGTNGFYLNFQDNSAATAAAIGKDSSGNGNNWTPNGISVTAGVTYDSMTDVPTLTGATNANFATLNAIDTGGGSVTLSGGNLNYSIASSTGSQVRGTMGTDLTSKWYWEYTAGSAASPSNPQVFGISTLDGQITNNSTALRLAAIIYTDAGTNYVATKYINGAGTSITTQFRSVAIGDILQVAYDAATGNLWFGKNNTWYDATNGTTGNPSTGSNPVFTLTTGSSMTPFLPNIGATYSGSLNCNQRAFSYTPPTGFKSLNTFNLPNSTIPNGKKNFDINLYTGTGVARSITNSGAFKPDFVWIKSRAAARFNNLYDSVRGVGKALYSNATNVEDTAATDCVTAFDSSGFSLGIDASSRGTNVNTDTYVGWQWKASNAAAVTNTSGSISSQVSANPSAGFSIVTYTGTGANATVGHGLGVAPSFIIVKCRNTAATGWLTYARPLTATSFLQLESTAAAASNATAWNNTTPTSTVFTIGTSAFCNGSTQTYVAYCFSEIEGYSKFGSYTGNGAADGVFVHLGFRPIWVMIKRTDSAGENWNINDTSRSTYNVTTKRLLANSSSAEADASTEAVDMLSNGFKIRTSDPGRNASGGTYIFMAFAENPFKNSLAR